MDLSKSKPRSPNEELLGIVSLARTIDKARAFNENRLGEYHYNCPHDQALFDFLGTDARMFAAKQRELRTDAAFERWVETTFLRLKTRSEMTTFNEARRAWRPEPGSESAGYFKEMRSKLAGEHEVSTWFELLDLDENRARLPQAA